MAGITFPWTQPVGGKVIVWRPLKVGDKMDLDGNYARSDRAYLKKYAEYAMRIIQFDGKEGFTVDQFREWDEYDLEALAEEVQLRELARAAQIGGQSGSSTPVQRLETSINEAQLAIAKVAENLKTVLVNAKMAESTSGPLAGSPS